MTNYDSEFLIWLAKRLVYKYKESTDIIGIVQNIIKKYSLEKQAEHYDMYKNISQIITELSDINNDFLTKIEKDQMFTKRIDTFSINSIFENINLDKLMK